MRRRVVAAITLLTVVLGSSGCAATVGDSPASAHPSADAVTAEINRVMQEGSITGAIVGLWRPGEDPYVKAFGVSDTATQEPMSTDLHMRIGSETKTFTVTALLQLVDEQKVRLDDPISRYIAGVPNGDAITLRDLAEMRSGLVDYLVNPAFVQTWLSDPSRQFTPQDLLSYSLGEPVAFAPGERYDYVNTNTILLGLVVEQVSHLSLDAFLQQHVFDPLGLAQTSLPIDAAFPTPHARGYTTVSLECVQTSACGTVVDTSGWNSSWGWAAGGMVSTLNDLHRWAPIVANGELLSAATQVQREQFLPTNLTDYEYGLGLMNFAGWIGHSGLLPGFESLTVYLPSEDATLVILVNSGPGAGTLPVFALGNAISTLITPDHVIIIA